MRLDGYDVYFLTGTDEHGIKMLQTAGREGITPQQLVERNTPRFQAMVERLNCSNDDFIRTTEERHHRSSAAIWERMEKAGDIYLDKYSGWYSVRDEAYYDESETTLNDEGQRFGALGTPVEWVEEESYFFRLSAYQDKLLDLYARHPADFVASPRRAPQRGRELRAWRPARIMPAVAHDLRLGHQSPRQCQAHHVCLGRRADELHHGRRLPRYR